MEVTEQRYSRLIEWFYYALAGVGLIGTQLQITRMPMRNFIDATEQFWLDVVSQPASLFLTVDVLVLSAVVFTWMFSEARRYRIRFVWVYFLGALFIGISFFVPLYMGVRQRHLRASNAVGDTPLQATDWVAVGIAVACSLAAMLYSIGTVLR